jgi:hypothetical protein
MLVGLGSWSRIEIWFWKEVPPDLDVVVVILGRLIDVGPDFRPLVLVPASPSPAISLATDAAMSLPTGPTTWSVAVGAQ